MAKTLKGYWIIVLTFKEIRDTWINFRVTGGTMLSLTEFRNICHISFRDIGYFFSKYVKGYGILGPPFIPGPH